MKSDRFAANICARRSQLVHFAWQRCGDWAQAEDLAHDTIVKALQARDRFDGRNVVAWLLRIMVNQHANLYRHAKVRTTARAFLDAATECHAEAACDVVKVLKQVHRLPEHYRDVLLSMAWHAGYSGLYDVAREVGASRDTVKTRLFRARAALTASLQQ